MDNFIFNVKYGINHVLDLNGYDHILFLIVLATPFLFANWKRVLILVTFFTIGHTLSLILGTYNIVKIGNDIVEFLIPLTILVVALYNVFTAGKRIKQDKLTIILMATLFFGLVHGFGFAREFKMFVGNAESKLILLLEFALGIEIAQIIIVLVVLFMGFLGQTIFRFSKRDWIMVVSAIVVGLVIPMIIQSELFS